MAALDGVDDGVALVAELLWELVPVETEEGMERVLVLVSEVDVVALLDVKLLAITVDVITDPVLKPPVEVELAAEVEDPTVVVNPIELPPNDEDPTTVELPENVEDPDVKALPEVELPEPELPVIPSRLKVPDQPW